MEHGFLSVPSGVKVPFRVLRPEDAPALQRVHARCSERTIYLHFFGSMEELSEAQARYFASIDGVDHFGLVALFREPLTPEAQFPRRPLLETV